MSKAITQDQAVSKGQIKVISNMLFSFFTLASLIFVNLQPQVAKASSLSPEKVLRKICEEHANRTTFAKSWIDSSQGVNVILRNGKIKNEPGFKILNSSFFEYVEGRHEIQCPAAFSQVTFTCRKSAGGEAYRYVFKKSKDRYFLTTVEIEFEE